MRNHEEQKRLFLDTLTCTGAVPIFCSWSKSVSACLIKPPDLADVLMELTKSNTDQNYRIFNLFILYGHDAEGSTGRYAMLQLELHGREA